MVALADDEPLFKLGKIVATPGAIQCLQKAGIDPALLLDRHSKGDWGNLCDADKKANDEAVQSGDRILSAYSVTTGVKIWIITEAAGRRGLRESTCLLLPEEY